MVGFTVVALQETLAGHLRKSQFGFYKKASALMGNQYVVCPVSWGMGMVVTPLCLHRSYVTAILEVIQSLSSW